MRLDNKVALITRRIRHGRHMAHILAHQGPSAVTADVMLQ